MSSERGYVYILENESLPGLVKIGRTNRDPFRRAAELDTTGVPTPFVVSAAFLVDDPRNLEVYLHKRFSEKRIRSRREFFSLMSLDIIREISIYLLNIQGDHRTSYSSQIQMQKPFADIAWHTVLKRELNSEIDRRLKAVEGEDYFKRLYKGVVEGDPEAVELLKGYDYKGSVESNSLLIRVVLEGHLGTDLERFYRGLIVSAPHMIPDMLSKYSHTSGKISEAFINIIGESDSLHFSTWIDNSLLATFLYSKDVIESGDLDPEVFFKKFAKNLRLSQEVADSLAGFMRGELWEKRLSRSANEISDRVSVLAEVIRQLRINPKGGWPE